MEYERPDPWEREQRRASAIIFILSLPVPDIGKNKRGIGKSA